MNFAELFNTPDDQKIKISILGSNGGFGYSLLAQCALIQRLQVGVVCDVDTQKASDILLALGWKAQDIKTCHSIEEVKEIVGSDKTAVIDNPELLPFTPVDMLIEATGNPELGAYIAEQAIMRHQHVGMVSKETESVVGPYLAKLARENQVTYTTVDGDQPSNLIHLYTWIAALGLEIVAAGKSSEYDYIWDEKANCVRYLDKSVDTKTFADLWPLSEDVSHTLLQRSKALDALPQYATPDYCEMNVVANSLDLRVDKEEMHYPICKITELADIFIPKSEGGILSGSNVVDVFNCLRRDDELSFAGGEFVIVKCHNQEVWKILKEKGHIVSKSGKYAAIILPYHLMGVESPISIFSAVLHNRASGNPHQQRRLIMAGRAERDFHKGEVLSMGGHHHIIQDVRPILLNYSPAVSQKAPFYLFSNKTLAKDVRKGDVFELEDFVLSDSQLYRMYQAI